MPPHIYATSSLVLKELQETKRPQTILVSGESGAGKSETVKLLMAHLADITSSTTGSNNTITNLRKRDEFVIGKVLAANPLLESFGNARTECN